MQTFLTVKQNCLKQAGKGFAGQIAMQRNEQVIILVKNHTRINEKLFKIRY